MIRFARHNPAIVIKILTRADTADIDIKDLCILIHFYENVV